jgi:hypothetical protein
MSFVRMTYFSILIGCQECLTSQSTTLVIPNLIRGLSKQQEILTFFGMICSQPRILLKG